MIRTIFFVFSLVCVVLVLGALAGSGFLWFSGKLDIEKAHEIYDLVLLEQTDDMEDAPFVPQQGLKDVRDARLERFLKEVRGETDLAVLKAQITSESELLEAKQKKHETEVKAFQDKLNQQLKASIADGMVRSREVVTKLKPADALPYLMQLDLQQNILLMRELPDGVIADLLKAFAAGTPEQQDRGYEIFTALTHGQPKKQVLQEAIDTAQQGAPAADGAAN